MSRIHLMYEYRVTSTLLMLMDIVNLKTVTQRAQYISITVKRGIFNGMCVVPGITQNIVTLVCYYVFSVSVSKCCI